MARDNGLPPKEGALFKSIIKHYELKQYKKGLKSSDQVLKKYPEHGETLAMKGLILNCMERKSEAYELVRKGVKFDIRSHVCWHVYGLLYRSDREYLQAIKCYRSALRHDSDNVQILRDLSLLQVQMRDLPGFVETRQKLLTLKPTTRNNWITFALSQHLSSRYDQAIGIVDAYERTLEGAAPESDYEHAEMLLYKNMLLEEGGKKEEALAHLEENESKLVDQLFLLEKRAQLLRELGRFEPSEAIYRQLLKRNSEHYGYHSGLQACVLGRTEVVERWLETTVDGACEARLQVLYTELQAKFPRSSVCRRLPLDFARDGSHFRAAATTYLLPPLRKGVPSLFADLKPLYASPSKAAALGEIFAGWLSSLETSGKLSEKEPKPELPTTLMWVRVLMAQHLDIMGDSPGGIKQMDLALEHSPTLPDLYMFKARIYKHGGALVAASEVMDTARKMDLADRYLNSKATRYMLRADQVEEAQKTIALFTRDGEQISNLFEMQCMWYELECGSSYSRTGDFGRALKNFTSVDRHFVDILEDQFDFHSYCIRKMTLRSYVHMLRMEDQVHGHAFYTKAATGLIETYLRLFDKPKQGAVAAAQDGLDEMSAAERKKAESKRRKAEAKAKAEAEAAAKLAAEAAAAEAKAAASSAGKKKAAAKEKPADADPAGAALAATEEPLKMATKFLNTLQLHAPAMLRTHVLAAEIAMRKKRYLMALRALRKAVAIAPTAPSVHCGVVRFLHEVEAAATTLPPTVAAVITANREALGAPPSSGLAELNEAYLAAQGGAPAAVLAAAEMQKLLAPAEAAKALARVAGLLPMKELALEDAVAAHQLLVTTFGDAASAADFKQKAHLRFPLSDYLKP